MPSLSPSRTAPPDTSKIGLGKAPPRTVSRSPTPFSPRPQNPGTSYLLFSVANQVYGFPLDHLVKILGRRDISALAAAEEPVPWWGGLFMQEGVPVPLISLRGLWGCDSLGQTQEALRQVVLLFRRRGALWALLVDQCLGVHRLSTSGAATLHVPNTLTGSDGPRFEAVIPWRDRLVVTVALDRVLSEKMRRQMYDLMKTKYQPLLGASPPLHLRDRELALSQTPSVEGYIELAAAYDTAGLHKEAARILKIAEQLEDNFLIMETGETSTEMFGRLKPGMLVEVIQVLSRTSRTGELRLETNAQTFHIYFKQGNIINTTSMHHPPGISSLIRAFQSTHGTYRFAHKLPSAVDQTFFKDTGSLLLEVMHLLDQSHHNQPAP